DFKAIQVAEHDTCRHSFRHLDLSTLLTFIHITVFLFISLFWSRPISCDECVTSLFGLYSYLLSAIFLVQFALLIIHYNLHSIPRPSLTIISLAVFGATTVLSLLS
ncbi:hypothetical protein PENTCL1PPCAC_15034, partial [Pristionchus entomophagus]